MSRGPKRNRPALVGNAADRSQVKTAERLEREQDRMQRSDMLAVLATPEGRRVLWSVLTFCRLLEETWDPSVLIHYLAGRQSVGHFVLGEIVAADPKAWLQMQVEHLEEEQRDDRTAEAASLARGDNDATEAG